MNTSANMNHKCCAASCLLMKVIIKCFPSDYFLQLKDIRRWKWACPEFCLASPTSFYWLLLWWVTRGRVCRMGGTKPRPVQSPVWRSVPSTWRVCAHFIIVILQTHIWFKTSQDQFIKNFVLIQVHLSVQLGLNGFSQFVNVCVSVQTRVVLRQMFRISPALWTTLSGISVVFSALCKPLLIIFIPSIDMTHYLYCKIWLTAGDNSFASYLCSIKLHF